LRGQDLNLRPSGYEPECRPVERAISSYSVCAVDDMLISKAFGCGRASFGQPKQDKLRVGQRSEFSKPHPIGEFRQPATSRPWHVPPEFASDDVLDGPAPSVARRRSAARLSRPTADGYRQRPTGPTELGHECRRSDEADYRPEERTRKREDLLCATEAALAKLASQIAAGRGPKGQDKVVRAVGRIRNRCRLAKLFGIVAECGFSCRRNPARIADEARIDRRMTPG
jgi:hypothetical protein